MKSNIIVRDSVRFWLMPCRMVICFLLVFEFSGTAGESNLSDQNRRTSTVTNSLEQSQKRFLKESYFGKRFLNSQKTEGPGQVTNVNTVTKSADFQAVQSKPIERREELPVQLRIEDGRAVSKNGPYSVAFAADAASPSAVELTTLSAERLRSRIFGLAYLDPENGKSALIATLRSSTGEVLPPNAIIYRDAFDGEGVSADLLYTATRTSLEQDVVIRRSLPSPETYGLSLKSRLAVFTEFLEAPTPRKLSDTLHLGEGLAEERLSDETLIFGSIRIVAGKAFVAGKESDSIPVAKRWEVIDGRTFLIESTPFVRLKAGFDSLPGRGKRSDIKPAIEVRTALRESKQPLERRTQSKTIRVAKAESIASPGVVLDYIIVTSPTLNVNFAGSSTPKLGFAAAGQTAVDYWNHYYKPSVVVGIMTNLFWSDTNSSTVGMVVSNAAGAWGFTSEDQMFSDYIYPNSGTDPITITFTNLPSNRYDFYLYGHAGRDVANASFKLFRAGTQIGYKGTTLWGWGWNSTNWESGWQYEVFRSVTVTNQTIKFEIPTGGDGFAYINGLQIVPSDAVPPAPGVSNLININFGGSADIKIGAAAVGISPDDYWNLSDQSYEQVRTLAPLITSDTNITASGLIVLNAPGVYGISGITDEMYRGFAYPWDAGNITILLTNLAAGNYDFYLYGHAGADDANSIFHLWTGGRDCQVKGTTLWGSRWNSTNWDEGQQFVVFRDVAVNAGGTVTIQCAHNATGYAYLNGMQIVNKGDTDSDGDGLPDAWELAYFGNLSQTATNDPDGDLVSNLREYQLSRNPNRANAYWNGAKEGSQRDLAWVDDDHPYGSYDDWGLEWYNEGWTWTDFWGWDYGWGLDGVYPHSGSVMHISDLSSYGDVHEHFYLDPYVCDMVRTGEVLYAYINIAPYYPPSEIMLQWYVVESDGIGSWEHRAFWGDDLIDSGSSGTPSRYRVGDLPTTGDWIRLEVPASAVGLEGKIVEGMRFTLWGGAVAWDDAGKSIPDVDGDGLPDSWEEQFFYGIGADPNADNSGDGLSNLQKYLTGQNPTVASAPAIQTQPQSQNVCLGAAANFYVVPTGTVLSSYKFQWRLNGVSIAGATASSFTRPAVSLADLGNYSVLITNAGGWIASAAAALTSNVQDSDYDGICDCEELANGTNPNDPNSVLPVRLGLWRFDNTNTFMGDAGQLPIITNNISGIPSWNTNAVKIAASDSSLSYRELEANACRANVNLRSGTLSFWFKPQWSSTNAGGIGPQTEARLFELGSKGSSSGWWGLAIGSGGTNVYFGTQTNSTLTLTTNLSGAISWVSNFWHQIVVTYSPTNSSLYIDGEPSVTNGVGVAYYPGPSVRAQGFYIGNSSVGGQQAKGAIDELETFNYALSSESVLSRYETAIFRDSDGDGWPDMIEEYFGTGLYSSGSIPQGVSIDHPGNGSVISR